MTNTTKNVNNKVADKKPATCCQTCDCGTCSCGCKPGACQCSVSKCQCGCQVA